MTKLIILFLCLTCLLLPSSSVPVECLYSNISIFMEFKPKQPLYFCLLSTDPLITSPNATSIEFNPKNHMKGKFNFNVGAIYINNKTVNYFPTGIGTTFRQLTLLSLRSSNLKEIHQSDMKSFKKLEYFDVEYNDIEIVEEGLFEDNMELIFISFSYNKITRIGLNVFDHLKKITSIILYMNACTNSNVWNAKSDLEIKNFIAKLDEQCKDSEFLSIKKDLKTISEMLSGMKKNESVDLKGEIEELKSDIEVIKLEYEASMKWIKMLSYLIFGTFACTFVVLLCQKRGNRKEEDGKDEEEDDIGGDDIETFEISNTPSN